MIDLIILILCARIIYIAISRGVLKELFKILGLICSSFAAFHWYPFLAGKIQDRLSASPVPLEGGKTLYFASFLFIFLTLLAGFAFLSMVSTSLIKKEEISVEEKRLALFMGGFRCVFASSVVLFVLSLSPVKADFFQYSLSYRALKNVAPAIYLGSFKIYNLFVPIKATKEVGDYYEAKGDL